jgi:hypothetical protein
MYNGSTILLCVTIFVIHKQCLIRAHCSIVTVVLLQLLATFVWFAPVMNEMVLPKGLLRNRATISVSFNSRDSLTIYNTTMPPPFIV